MEHSPVHHVFLSSPELETVLTALRYLQENLEQLPREFVALTEGDIRTEAEIDDLCARLSRIQHKAAA